MSSNKEKKHDSLIYLISPYTSPIESVEDFRFTYISEVMMKLRKMGWNAVSPIALCHPIRRTHDLPGSYRHWETICDAIRSRSIIDVLVKMDGWEESTGVRIESANYTGYLLSVNYHDKPAEVAYEIHKSLMLYNPSVQDRVRLSPTAIMELHYGQ